ncbi:hypothetical protein ACH5RR_025162 [Cinchona calisaya]|uniref:Uncharacterized protein n=1 Tax=Cinchona calisaya TaxID=153742 RepID=A0ABD2Z268_9GENT
MVAEAFDLTEGTSHDLSLGMGFHLESAATQTQAFIDMGNGYAPKVRKPYTIKKQREKWTEEEHQRFLEALRLYGRSWRQIEEHVGTKTAIQIRSHAQKFFAKIARDSNECEGSLNPIDIPPPRPKKKPIHPYPRKMVDIPKTILVDPHQPERSPRKRSGEEGNSSSPTSVLSVLGSDTSGSPFSELQRSRLSPMSYTNDDAHSANVQFPENDNGCMTSDSSVEEERECVETTSVAASEAPVDKSTRGLDLLTPGTACSVDDPAAEAVPTTIKLFGRMVEIKENEKSSSSAAENSLVSPSNSLKERLDFRNSQHMMGSTANNIESQVPFSLVPSCITPLPFLVPQYVLREECGHVGAIPHIIPFWTWSHCPVLPNISSCNHTAVETVVDSPNKCSVENEEPQREGSSTGSNSGSVTGVNIGHLNFDAIQSKHLGNIEKQRSAKGFMPYKRCLAERDATSSIIAAEEREGQRARICS